MNKEKGLVLLAGFNHYYATAALGLIATIRNRDKSIPILLYTTEGLFNNQKMHLLEHLFSVTVKTLDPKYYMTGDKVTFFKAKNRMYELSPFEKTLYLDVDMAWLPRRTVTELLDSLSGVPFTMISEGYYDTEEGVLKTSGFYHFWADKYDIIDKYPEIKKHGRLYQLRSEMMYFEKSPEVKKLFSLAKKVIENPLVRPTEIGECAPDELGFNIAVSVLKMWPHQDRYNPIFWEFKRMILRQPVMDEHEIKIKYFAYSVGGNETQPGQRMIYNNLIKGSMNAAGIPSFARALIDKKEIPALKRQKI